MLKKLTEDYIGKNLFALLILAEISLLLVAQVISAKVTFIWGILFLINYFNWGKIWDNKFAYIALIILLAYSCEVSMQLMIEHTYDIGFTYQKVIDFILYLFIYLLCGELFNNKKIGLCICLILSWVMITLNLYVTFYRGRPIYFPDLFSAATVVDVAGKYTLFLSKIHVVCTLLFVTCFLPIMCPSNKCEPISIKEKWIKIGVLLVIPCLVILLKIPTALQLRGYFFSTTEYWLYSFAMSGYQMQIEEPENYEPDEKCIEVTSDILPFEASSYPNVVFVMNESFADFRIFSDFFNSEKIIPFFDKESSEYDSISGNLHVSIYGGNTANTEFEVLTGISMNFLPYDTTAYNLYINSETYSLATYFNDLGYRTIAFHPSAKTNYNRNKVYPNLGFQETYF